MKILTDNSLTVLWNRLKKGILNNRNYEPTEFSGKGYKVLEKNIQTVGGVKKNILTPAMINQPNTIYEIRYDFDLEDAEVIIPEGCVLKFNGGKIKNGNILGSGTCIQAEESTLFTNIHIAGDWAVPVIKSSMFSDITENNKIKELFNLSSNILKNTIIIEKGDYQVSATSSNETVIDVKNNTDVILNGTITLIPNNLINARIIRCFIVKNISISGSGSIVGDKMSHTGTTGEWGHGISITGGCQNITIKGITIKNCWGDGIAIDDAGTHKEPNKNITIENFTIDNCRRQGISIISAEKCIIKNGFINNISGTAPYLGIDIEPNKDGYCKDISIIGVTIDSLLGIGCHTYTGVQNFNISIEKCRIFTHGEATNGDYAGITATGVKGLFIKENVIEDDILSGLSLRDSNSNVIISNNIINCKRYVLLECAGNILSNNTISNELGISISDSVLSKNNFISTGSFIYGHFHRNIVAENIIDCNELKDEPNTSDNVFSGNMINATTKVLCNKSSRFTDNKITTSQLSVLCPYFAHNECHVNTFDIFSTISGCILHAKNGTIRGSICEGTTFWQTGNPTSGEAFIDVYADMKDCIIHQDASFTATRIVLYIRKAGVLLNNIKVAEKCPEIYDIYSGYNYILKDCIVTKYTQPLLFSDIRIANQGSERPALNQYQKGFNFFDTTLNKPIYWIGTKWVDATGLDV